MPEKSTLIGPLHAAIFDYLSATTELEPAKILRREKGKPLAMLREAAARCTLGLVILRPILKQLNPNLPGPFASHIEITFQVFEHAALNKAALDAPGLAEQLMIAIDGLTLTGGGYEFQNLIPVGDPREVEDADFDIIELTYATSGGLTPRD